MRLYVNTKTYEVRPTCEKEAIISEMVEYYKKTGEDFEELLSRFSRSFIFNMDENKKNMIRGVFERRLQIKAREEFEKVWRETTL